MVKKKKIKRKALKRKVARKKTPKRKCLLTRLGRFIARKKPARKSKKVVVKAPAEVLAGKVIHYFPKVRAGVIKVTKGTINPGDRLHIRGHTTDLKQTATSMEINRVPIKQAKKGDEIGLLVVSRVRRKDSVYKLL